MIKCVFEVLTKHNLETMRNLNRITKKIPTLPWSIFSEIGFCYQKGDPMSYNGHLLVNIYNNECLPWIQFDYVDADFPDVSLVAASNFCRNPRNDKIGLWCYMADGVKDFCNMLWCISAGLYQTHPSLFASSLFSKYA